MQINLCACRSRCRFQFNLSLLTFQWEWKKPGSHAANRIDARLFIRPSSTAARTVATQCAPRGDQRMRRRLAMRALAISSTDAPARELEIAFPAL